MGPEQHGEGDLIELDTMPVGFAVNTEVLGEAAVLVLTGGEVDPRAQRGFGVAGRQEGGRAVDEIPHPDQVVAAGILIPLRFAPRDREGGDQRALERFVLVGQ